MPNASAADALQTDMPQPTLIEIDEIDQLEREVFGPVLHVLRYRRSDLDALIAQINAIGYGLTAGVHTRIDETIARVAAQIEAGNLYVNRNLVGAVVGVQPFGGEGLSGTGPKAGGPLYLLRSLARKPAEAARRAVQASGEDEKTNEMSAFPGHILIDLLQKSLQKEAAPKWLKPSAGSPSRRQAPRLLTGPTGERNIYQLHPRPRVLCLAGNANDRLLQLAAVLAVGAQAIWPADAEGDAERLPPELRARIALAADWHDPRISFDALLLHGTADDALAAQRALAPGDADIPLERLLIERAISINTAAAGGNASLMTMA